jgi:hypothetical protein
LPPTKGLLELLLLAWLGRVGVGLATGFRLREVSNATAGLLLLDALPSKLGREEVREMGEAAPEEAAEFNPFRRV